MAFETPMLTLNEKEWRNQPCYYGRDPFDDENLMSLSTCAVILVAKPTHRQPWLYVPSPTLMSDKAYANYQESVCFIYVQEYRTHDWSEP